MAYLAQLERCVAQAVQSYLRHDPYDAGVQNARSGVSFEQHETLLWREFGDETDCSPNMLARRKAANRGFVTEWRRLLTEVRPTRLAFE